MKKHLIYIVITLCVASIAQAQDKRLTSLRQFYQGPDVKTREDLGAYTGIQAVDAIVGPWRQAAYIMNYEQLAANYNLAVEFQLRRQQVILCPQTAEFLYTQFTPLSTNYPAGSRPELEAIVKKVTANSKNDQEKMLSIMRFCRDLKKKKTPKCGPGFIYGGTEEYIIEKGSDLCECLGRLFVALCEIAHIPARIVMHNIGGHITAEAYVDGKWGYVDPKTGLYFLTPDGKLASLWQLCLNPDLTNNQPDHVKADIADKYSWEQRVTKCRTRYLQPNEVNGFENYSLANSAQYDYSTFPSEQAVDAGLFRINKLYGILINHVFGLVDSDQVSEHFVSPRSLAALTRLDAPGSATPEPSTLKFIAPPPPRISVPSNKASFTTLRTVRLELKSKILPADLAGKTLAAKVIVPVRPLASHESLTAYINGRGPLQPIKNVPRQLLSQTCRAASSTEVNSQHYYVYNVDPKWIWLGDNLLRIVYKHNSPQREADMQLGQAILLVTLAPHYQEPIADE